MTIRECYENIGSNYEDVLERLGNEMLVQKFALKFLEDTTFRDLEESIEEQNGEKAFWAVHTLKGVSLNLGFQQLGEASAALTEALRHTRDMTGCEALIRQVEDAYRQVMEALGALKESLF